jgi:hypothetical protein
LLLQGRCQLAQGVEPQPLQRRCGSIQPTGDDANAAAFQLQLDAFITVG